MERFTTKKGEGVVAPPGTGEEEHVAGEVAGEVAGVARGDLELEGEEEGRRGAHRHQHLWDGGGGAQGRGAQGRMIIKQYGVSDRFRALL